MFPVVLAAACFGPLWSGKVIEFVVDNEAVVEVLKATYSKDFHLMHFITDVVVNDACSPSVISQCSKTDPSRIGYQVVLGSTRDDLCPVAALLAYLA